MRLSRKAYGISSFLMLSTLMVLSFQNCNHSAFEVIGDTTLSSGLGNYSSVPTFTEISKMIIEPQCLACHNSGLYNFSTYATLMGTGTVVAGSPSQSSFYTTLASGQMPKGGPHLTDAQLKAVSDWIAAGAPENASSSPMPSTPAAPSEITNLMVVSVTQNTVSLSWTLPSQGLTSIDVERSYVATGVYYVVATLSPTETTYTDANLTSKTTFYYRLRGHSSSGDTPYTLVVSGQTTSTTSAPPGTPSAPTGLTVTAQSASQINLGWVDTSSNETGFKVERGSSAGGPFTVLTTLPAGSQSYSDSSLPPATTYYYRVSATNASGSSSPTATLSAMTFGTYSWLASNVFQPKCTSCHGGSSPKAGYNLTSYQGSLSQVTSGNSSQSNLYLKTSNGSMPPSGPLSSEQIQAIKTWIDSGAANN